MALLKPEEKPDIKIQRPQTTEAKRRLVKEIYQHNGWGKHEHKANCEMENFPLRALDEYSDSELQMFIDDFESRKMVLFITTKEIR